MTRMTRRQRLTLAALGITNLVALSVLGVLLLRGNSQGRSELAGSPIDPQRLKGCRAAISDALLNSGHGGFVNTQEGGAILIQMREALSGKNPRTTGDAAVWTALEAAAGHGACLGFQEVQVTVLFSPPEDASCPGGICPELQAMAHADIPDLMLWSLGEINDAELALRIDYRPAATSTLPLPGATLTP